jgi:hypothetical protein
MHSHTSKPLDTELSLSIAKSIKSKAKSRFDNAYQAILTNKETIYVQGFIAVPGSPYKPIEHSWIESETSIIDPTLPYLGVPAADIHYFPAHRLTIKQLKAAIEEAEEDYPDDDVLPVYGDAPYAYYGDLMLGGNEYLEAHQAAEAKCRELNKPKSPITGE